MWPHLFPLYASQIFKTILPSQLADSQFALRYWKLYPKLLSGNVMHRGSHRYRSDSRLLLKNNQCTNNSCLQIKGENVMIKVSV